MSSLAVLVRHARSRAVRRAALTLAVACVLSIGLSLAVAGRWREKTTARLNSAAARLDSLTDRASPDQRDRAAVAWGYTERLRLGLESPFRLVEAAGRDPRLTADERRTVAWGLLAHVVHAASHHVEPAALDGLGPIVDGRSVRGERHLQLIDSAMAKAENPREAELALRIAYTLAVAERLVDGSAPVIVAEAAALVADREIARREAVHVIRSARNDDPLEQVRARRAKRAFYVERPTLLAPSPEIEHKAVDHARALLGELRAMHDAPSADSAASLDSSDLLLARRLYTTARAMPPVAPLGVTVQRYLPMLKGQTSAADNDLIAHAYNGEMLAAAVDLARVRTRSQRRAIGRVLMAAAVSMRSLSQQPLWFAGDSVATAAEIAASTGVSDIIFDRGVPTAWQPYFLLNFAASVRDLRRVFPGLQLDQLHVRFRATSPADSALAMHDPRTRTLHLPVFTAGGTLSHELAHDLDRQSAVRDGLAGYRSDVVARGPDAGARGTSNSRLAASLRAVTEEMAESPRNGSNVSERPAEIFATRVDWFTASALAKQGISDGFLSAVQDELLTGHVVHPERLRGASRSRSLLTALESMTSVAPFALASAEPSVQTMLRWSLNTPVDRRTVADILRGDEARWLPPMLLGARACEPAGGRDDERVALIRLAAESRARGWLRLRARWTAERERPAWARAALEAPPYSENLVARRVARLRDYILLELTTGGELAAGIGAYATPLVHRALCD